MKNATCPLSWTSKSAERAGEHHLLFYFNSCSPRATFLVKTVPKGEVHLVVFSVLGLTSERLGAENGSRIHFHGFWVPFWKLWAPLGAFGLHFRRFFWRHFSLILAGF